MVDRLTNFLLLVLLVPATAAAEPFVAVGKLANPDVFEASGLARSNQAEDRYWVINDSGHKPLIYAINQAGERLGSLLPRGIGNRDWEDLASFTADDGTHYLLVADVGDNNAVRNDVVLHAIAEPATLPGAGRLAAVDVAWSLSVTYPGGGRDTESVAVSDGYIYLLTKRTLPPELYRTPLGPGGDGPRELEFLGRVGSLPPPTVLELADAPRTRQFGWQPTAMSFSSDGRRAIVVTNWRAFVYSRGPDTTWFEALGAEPVMLPMPDVRRGESVCFSTDGKAALITFEGRYAPIYRAALP